MTNLYIRNWLTTAILIVLISIFSYLIAQKIIEYIGTNEQVELAQNVSSILSKGGAPGSGISLPQIDVSESISPFVIVYDSRLNPLAYTGTIGGNVPKPEDGVFENAKEEGEVRTNWKVQDNVNVSAVIRPYKNDAFEGFVLAGRNNRETQAQKNAAAGYILTFLVLSLFATYGWLYYDSRDRI